MTDPIIDQINERIAKLGLTQTKYAGMLGWSQPNVSAYLAGKRQPSIGQLRRMAGAVGLTIPPAKRSRCGQTYGKYE